MFGKGVSCVRGFAVDFNRADKYKTSHARSCGLGSKLQRAAYIDLSECSQGVDGSVAHDVDASGEVDDGGNSRRLCGRDIQLTRQKKPYGSAPQSVNKRTSNEAGRASYMNVC